MAATLPLRTTQVPQWTDSEGKTFLDKKEALQSELFIQLVKVFVKEDATISDAERAAGMICCSTGEVLKLLDAFNNELAIYIRTPK